MMDLILFFMQVKYYYINYLYCFYILEYDRIMYLPIFIIFYDDSSFKCRDDLTWVENIIVLFY